MKHFLMQLFQKDPAQWRDWLVRAHHQILSHNVRVSCVVLLMYAIFFFLSFVLTCVVHLLPGNHQRSDVGPASAGAAE